MLKHGVFARAECLECLECLECFDDASRVEDRCPDPANMEDRLKVDPRNVDDMADLGFRIPFRCVSWKLPFFNWMKRGINKPITTIEDVTITILYRTSGMYVVYRKVES